MSQTQPIRLAIPDVSEMLPAEHFSSSSIRTVIPVVYKDSFAHLPAPLAGFLMRMNAFARTAFLVTAFLAMLSLPVITSLAAYSMVSQSQSITVIRTQEVPSSGINVNSPQRSSTDVISSADRG